jgi:hypothetical protein
MLLIYILEKVLCMMTSCEEVVYPHMWMLSGNRRNFHVVGYTTYTEVPEKIMFCVTCWKTTGWIHHDWNRVVAEVYWPIKLKLFYQRNRCLKSNMILKLILVVLCKMFVLFLKKLRCWQGSCIFWWIWWSDLLLVGAFVMGQGIELNSSYPLYRLSVVAGRNCHYCGITSVRLNGSTAAASYVLSKIIVLCVTPRYMVLLICPYVIREIRDMR